jgi:MraZ protein
LADYEFGVDDKRRVQVPAKWRPPEPEGSEYMLVEWQVAQQPVCLLALPPEACAAMDTRLLGLKFGDPEAEQLRRVLSGKSDMVTMDGAGRICLPQRLAEKAGIKEKALLVGMWDRFQIWSPQRYASVKDADQANTSKLMGLI